MARCLGNEVCCQLVDAGQHPTAGVPIAVESLGWTFEGLVMPTASLPTALQRPTDGSSLRRPGRVSLDLRWLPYQAPATGRRASFGPHSTPGQVSPDWHSRFPPTPARLPGEPVVGEGLHRPGPAHPTRPPFYANDPRCRSRLVFLGAGFRLGLPPDPPRDVAVASGSELAPPLPPKDFHLLATARAGRTQGEARLALHAPTAGFSGSGGL
jgi:hypothetical protein